MQRVAYRAFPEAAAGTTLRLLFTQPLTRTRRGFIAVRRAFRFRPPLTTARRRAAHCLIDGQSCRIRQDFGMIVSGRSSLLCLSLTFTLLSCRAQRSWFHGRPLCPPLTASITGDTMNITHAYAARMRNPDSRLLTTSRVNCASMMYKLKCYFAASVTPTCIRPVMNGKTPFFRWCRATKSLAALPR